MSLSRQYTCFAILLCYIYFLVIWVPKYKQSMLRNGWRHQNRWILWKVPSGWRGGGHFQSKILFQILERGFLSMKFIKDLQPDFLKMRGRGSKAIWNFSENSSVLGPWPVPYWNSRKGRGSDHPSCEFFSSEWILWLGLWTPSYWSLCKIFHQHRDLKSATIKCESLSIHVCAGMMIEFALGTPHDIKPCWVFLFVKTSSPAHDIIWYLGSSA